MPLPTPEQFEALKRELRGLHTPELIKKYLGVATINRFSAGVRDLVEEEAMAQILFEERIKDESEARRLQAKLQLHIASTVAPMMAIDKKSDADRLRVALERIQEYVDKALEILDDREDKDGN